MEEALEAVGAEADHAIVFRPLQLTGASYFEEHVAQPAIPSAAYGCAFERHITASSPCGPHELIHEVDDKS